MLGKRKRSFLAQIARLHWHTQREPECGVMRKAIGKVINDFYNCYWEHTLSTLMMVIEQHCSLFAQHCSIFAFAGISAIRSRGRPTRPGSLCEMESNSAVSAVGLLAMTFSMIRWEESWRRSFDGIRFTMAWMPSREILRPHGRNESGLLFVLLLPTRVSGSSCMGGRASRFTAGCQTSSIYRFARK